MMNRLLASGFGPLALVCVLFNPMLSSARSFGAISPLSESEIHAKTAAAMGPIFTVLPQNGNVSCDVVDIQMAYQSWRTAQASSVTAVAQNPCILISVTDAGPLMIGEICNSTATIIFTATDDCGNQTTASATFTVIDQLLPVFDVLPLSDVRQCSPNSVSQLASWIHLRANSDASDNCTLDEDLLFSMKINGNFVDSAAVQAAFLASQNLGCRTENIDGTTFYKITGAVEVHFIVEDECGQAVSWPATFAVQDTSKPVWLVAPMTVFQSCSNVTQTLNQWLAANGNGSAMDACNSLVLTQNSMLLSQNCAQNGLWKGTFTATDGCSNTAIRTANFSILDTLAPVISISQTTVLEACGGGDDQTNLQNFINQKGDATLTDNCSTAAWTTFYFSTNNGQTGNGTFGAGPFPTVPTLTCDFQVSLRFRASDDCGNKDSVAVLWKIEDKTAPVFAVPSRRDTLACQLGEPPVSQPSATDNCDATLAFSMVSLRKDSLCGGRYTLERTWTATDDCANKATAKQIFVFLDTIAPVLSVYPNNLTVECDAVAAAAVLTVSDNCSGVPLGLIFAENTTKNADPTVCAHHQYQITRTWTATDGCGNVRNWAQNVQVRDTQGPVFSGNAAPQIACDNLAAIPVPTAADACGGPISAIIQIGSDVIIAGSCADSYQLKREYASTDVCSNQRIFTQISVVSDTSKPVLVGVPIGITVDCQPPAPPVLGQNGFAATDNCDPTPTVILNETTTKNADPTNCDHYNYWLTREWLVTDNCSNARIYAQTIRVVDQKAPVLQAVDSVLVPNGAGLCGANFTVAAPISFIDECQSAVQTASISQTKNIENTSGQPDLTARVDDLVFQITVPNAAANLPTVGSVVLTIDLADIDAEQPTEIFKIEGEKGENLGQTTLSMSQCGTSQTVLTIASSLFNTWKSDDGQVVLKLKAIGSGTDAINKICANSSATANFSYAFLQPTLAVDLKFSIDGGVLRPFPPPSSDFLNVGFHKIKYVAEDCSGNKDSVETAIEVKDIFPPAMIPPANATAFSAPTDCQNLFDLPALASLSDNCGFSQNFDGTSAQAFFHFYNDANAGFVPRDQILVFENATPNAVGSASLRLKIKADDGDAGEFFQLLDENGNVLGQPNQSGASQCTMTTETVFTFSASQINAWAAGDGKIRFTLRPNRDAISFSDFVGPCGALNPADSTDGQSFVEGNLGFSWADVDFDIKRSGNGASILNGKLIGNQTKALLPVGKWDIFYRTLDANQNLGETFFTVEVKDTAAPKAICKGATISVNPNGLASTTINPQQINGGSFDNCGPVTMTVSPASVGCSAGTISAFLTVKDTSGNSATCSTLIEIVSEKAAPTFIGYTCQSDTLFLFTNPPNMASGQFTYEWTGPNSFFSTAENPFVPSVSLASEGSYSVKIKGLTGCEAVSAVSVDIQETPTTPVLTALNSPFCEGEDLILKTQTYADPAANYRWFKGIFPNGQLLGQGVQPQFLVVAPAIGTHDYYAIVDEFGCTSAPSTQLAFAVTATPTAAVAAPGITVCEGQPFALEATAGPQNFQWTGPNGFASSAQFPPVFQSAALADAGNYSLIVFENGCPSAPVSVNVLVKDAPPQPLVGASGAICSGGTVSLVSDVTNGEKYIWYPPNFPTKSPDTTFLNGFSIQNATPSVSGNWKLVVFKQGCPSPFSASAPVLVKDFPAVAASNDGPSCVGAPVMVSATANQTNVQYAWTGPNGFQNYSSSATISQPISGTYSVTVTNDINCSTTASTTVLVAPKPTIVSISHDAPSCEDDSKDVTLSALVSPPSPDYVYEWTGPLGFTSSDPNPVLLGANASWNGSFTLRVNRAIGNADCESAPKSTTIFIKETPETPAILAQNALCEGDFLNVSVSNTGAFPPSADFVWTTPLGTVTTTDPSLSINTTAAANAGNYSVEALIGGCSSALSAAAQIVINPIPSAPQITSNSPVCEGATLEFSVPLVADMSYSWAGQSGFSASVFNPNIQNAMPQNSGAYLVQVAQNGCKSAFSMPYFATVYAKPTTPTLSGISQICLDQPPALVNLWINQNTVTSGATSEWFQQISAGNSQLLGTTGGAPTFNYAAGAQFSEGTFQFTSVASKNDCKSAESAAFDVKMFEIPTISANAGLDFKSCLGLSQALSGENPATGAGVWSQISGPQTAQISNATAAETALLGISEMGVFGFSWTLSNGACQNFDADSVFLTVNENIAADAGPSIDTCFAQAVRLAGVLPSQAGVGFWSQPVVQEALGIQILNKNDPATLVSNLNPGNAYTFFWNLPDFGCGPTNDEMIVSIRNAQPDAGQDRSECGSDGCEILAAAPLFAGQMGGWKSDDPDLQIFGANATSAEVCGLKSGENKLIWQIDGGFCGLFSRDTVRIFYSPSPVARADSFGIPFGQLARLNLVANDFLASDFDVSIFFEPKNGKLSEVIEGVFEYISKSGFSGDDFFIYKICDPTCPDACTTGEVKITVESQGDCTPPTIITPNGDGVNDAFIVPCLGGDAAPVNTVTIFNEWGDEVFYEKSYKQNWQGDFKGQPLPAGTYFYLIRFDNAIKPKTGFLVIHR